MHSVIIESRFIKTFQIFIRIELKLLFIPSGSSSLQIPFQSALGTNNFEPYLYKRCSLVHDHLFILTIKPYIEILNFCKSGAELKAHSFIFFYFANFYENKIFYNNKKIV